MAPLTVEIWSDVVCPWCYLGKRRFETALEQFPQRDDVQAAEHLASKYGVSVDQASDSQRHLTALAAEEGLEYHLDRTQGGNTFDAHRVLQLAGTQGLMDPAMER